MQRLKKLLALVLAICMIIGVPMSVDVSATGKPDATDFTITQALVVPDSWGVSSDIVAPNKGILPYFTGGTIGNVYDSVTSTDPTANGQSTAFGMAPENTLYSNILVTVCNNENRSFGDINNSPLVWGCKMDINDAVSAGPNNYFSKLSGSVSVDRLPNSLTAAQKAKYTTAIDTLDEIFMLAADLGGKVQYRLFELGNFCTPNGLVECYYDSSDNVQLTGQIKVNASGIYNGGSADDIYDCAIADVVRVGVDTVDFLKAEFVEDENSLRLTFREGLSYGFRGNNYTKAGLAVINSKGQMMSVLGSGDGATYKTEKEVTVGALEGYTKLYYDSSMTFEQVVYNGSSYSVNKCFLNPTQLAKYREFEAHVVALNQADPDGGYLLCYTLSDVSSKMVSTRGESTANHFVDAVWGAGSRPLYANYTNAELGVIDMAAQPIVSIATDPANDKPLTLKGVFINPKSDSQVVLTFSEPIKTLGTIDVRLYPVDANLDSAIDKNYAKTSYWTVQDLKPYGNVGNQLIGTLKVPNSTDNQSYKAVINAFGDRGPMMVAIWDSSWVRIPSNGYVDAISSVDGAKHLQADKTAAFDIALTSITQETISVEKVRLLNDKVLEVTWSDGITEGLYRNDATAWKSIRLTNDLLELQKDTAGNWMQDGGYWSATSDPAVWHLNLYHGVYFSNIINKIKPGGAYEGLKMTFAIENDPVNTELVNLVDNITSVDGIRPVDATNDGTTEWRDGSYTVITLAPTPHMAIAVGNSQVRIRLENAGTLGNGTVSIGNVAATSLVAESDTCYLATFPAGTVTDTAQITVPAGLFTGVLGNANEAATLSCGVSFGAAGATVTLNSATTYSFMNADTGREIAVGTTTEFTPNALGHNVYTFTANGRYLDLTGATAALTDTPISYQIKACDNERYVLYANNGLAVCDTDGGSTGNPELGLTEVNQLSIGWYLTAAGQTKPLRILPIGDSITFGTNPDTVGPLMGWRDNLSQILNTQLNRFVFVGNQVAYITDVNSDILTRHEGNPGWTVKDHGTRNGIYDLVPGVVNKYDPDVVCMMIGINDMAAYGGKNAWNDTIKAEIQTNYTDLVAALAVNMDDTDTIFCSTLTPMTSDHSMAGMELPFNEMFPAFITELAKTYPQVKLNDNYGALVGKENVVCSDGIHLSLYGDTFIAQRYADSIMSVYDKTGNKRGAEYELQAQLNQAVSGSTVTLDANYDTTGTDLLRIPAGVTLDLNGHTVIAANLFSFGQIIDSSEGQGGVIIGLPDDNNFTLLQENNAALPLYDTTFGGYRFFSLTVTNKTPRSGENFVKYGINLKFGDEDAYRLLQDTVNANVKLSVALIINDSKMTYTFGSSMLSKYAATVLGDMTKANSYVITLTLSGLSDLASGSTISATPEIRSTTRVIKAGSAQTYTYTPAV